MTHVSIWTKLKLPIIILIAFLLAAIWMLGGRLLFGVFGWMFFILLFTVVPIIVIYGIVLAAIVAVRQRSYIYRKSGPFMISLMVTLGAIFISGMFMPDAGDAKDSGTSALSTILMDRTNPDLIGISGAISGWALFIAFVAAVIAFIFVFAERPRKSVDDRSNGVSIGSKTTK